MKVNNSKGSKERLKEMFERVNKVKLNETFDVPVVDDKAYLDKTGDKEAEKEQPNKYDGGVDYPAIDDLKTDNEALNKIAEEEELDEISLAGLKGAGQYVGNAIGDKFKQGANRVKDAAGNVKKAYHKSSGNNQLGKIQKYATDFGEKFGKYLAKYNEQAVKAGEQELQPRQIGMVILNALDTAYKTGSDASINLDRLKMQKESEEIEGGLADEADPNEFLPDQILKGIEVEMEHTNDPRQALEIAMDHLVEIPDYYDHLGDMEDEAGVDGEQEMPTSTMRAMADDMKFAPKEDQPEKSDDETDHSADVLLDPSQHWVDDYTPKKLGDEIAIDEIKDWDGNEVPDVSPQLQKWLEFHKMSKDEYDRLPYQEKLNLINQYQKVNPPQQSQEPQGDPEGIANWLARDKAAGRSPMDETDATQMSFNDDGRGNWIPQGMEDKNIAIRKVEQPMGSGNEKYLVVQLDQNGGVEDIYDKKDTWEEAVDALGASIS